VNPLPHPLPSRVRHLSGDTLELPRDWGARYFRLRNVSLPFWLTEEWHLLVQMEPRTQPGIPNIGQPCPVAAPAPRQTLTFSVPGDQLVNWHVQSVNTHGQLSRIARLRTIWWGKSPSTMLATYTKAP
jgi:hypothetical protein